MSKIKYRFNTKSLTFERAKLSPREIFLRVVSYLATGLVFATLVIVLAYKYFDSPKERQLLRENEYLKIQYEILKRRVDLLAAVLEDLQKRDDNIYRVIFEAEPIADNIRKAGFGGVNRYKSLEGFDNSQIVIEATKKIDRLAKQMYIQSKSFDEVFKLAKNKEAMLASIPAIQPISNKDLTRVISGFGYRTHPIYKIQHLHTGIDFTAPIGTEVYATGDGIVKEINTDYRGYGNHVIISHGFGYETLYAHLSKFNGLKPGQKVKRGEVIGYVGNTGTSTGPHLHYEVIKNGEKINPVNFFYNDLTPEEYQKMIELASQAGQSFD